MTVQDRHTFLVPGDHFVISCHPIWQDYIFVVDNLSAGSISCHVLDRQVAQFKKVCELDPRRLNFAFSLSARHITLCTSEGVPIVWNIVP